MIGIISGAISGFLGVGGATIIIPALVVFLGFDQKTAQGTSLMTLLPPIGILAAIEYYKSGYVNIKAALLIALFFIIGSWISSKFAVKINPDILRKIFSIFLIIIAIKMLIK